MAVKKITNANVTVSSLLKLSYELSNIRSRKGLINVINNCVSKLFAFENISIFLLNKDAQNNSYILASPLPTTIKPPCIQELSDTKQTEQICKGFEMADQAGGMLLLNLEAYINNETCTAYLKYEYEYGIREKVILILKNEKKLLGLLSVNAKEKGTYTKQTLELLKGVAYQISLSVTKILANEEIEKRENEKSKLLAFSNEIARVRDKNGLLRILADKLKELFSISGFGITLLNKDGKTHSPYIVEGYHQILKATDYTSAVQKYPVEDNVFNIIVSQDDACILEVKEVLKIVGAPAYAHLWKTKGVKRILGVPLRVSENVLGCLIFHLDENFKKYKNHNLIKGVCAQISVAISNIKANDEIARREEEKVILLSLSNEIAAIKNRNDFFHLVNFQLQSLFEIKEFGIAQINTDRKSYCAFVLELEGNIRDHNDFNKITSAKYEVNDPVFSVVMNSELPTLLDVNKLVNEPAIPEYVGFWKNVGLQRVLAVPLRESGNDIGCIFLHVDGNETLHLKSHLLSGICAQLAVKISDIAAREEIEQRENEKSRLLSFSNELVYPMDRKQLTAVLSKELRKFGLGNYGISLMTENQRQLVMFLYELTDFFTNHLDFDKIIGTPVELDDGISNVVLGSNQPVTFNIEELNKRKGIPEYIKWWRNIGIIELTGISIRLGSEYKGILWLNIPVSYDKESNFPLLKSISSQIGIALSNLLANEKIVSQLNEIKIYKERLEEEIIYLQEEIDTTNNYAEIIGESLPMQKVFRLMGQVAHSDSTVLLLGETGTGKELVARAIHNNSPRKNKMMVKVNCAALPANLIESELFGHERGSFTGATDRRLGKFELANGGTLFLDEIGEMPLELQVKLLRALQEREIERIGGRTVIKVDVRIIAATNRNLEKEMNEGRFRSDLYYRLNIFPITLPALRERKEDISLLTTHFISRFGKKAGRKITVISKHAMQDILMYDWPGNIRELEHLIERSILLCEGETLKTVYLPASKKSCEEKVEKNDFFVRSIDDMEREHILKTLKYCHGRVGGYSGAAELLDVPPSTLFSKMKKLGLKRNITSDVISQ